MGVSRRLIQRFEVAEQLGSGGMGTVYRAWDPQLERDVAIKVLAEDTRDPALQLSSQETLDLRSNAPRSPDDLLSEARMMARLSHPNVLPVYEVGLADGAVFVVMEHIAGCNLRDWLGEPRQPAEIIAAFMQAGRGLAAAHERGIVHRDFKPENVLIGSDGRVRVADFGLSRLTATPATTLIRIDDGRGTPRYMAPELWRGDSATVASDVFAFATTFVEAIGGDAKLRTLQPRLRRLLAAALSEEPARRPPLTAILDALQGPRISPRWFVGGAAAALVVGVTTAVLTSHDRASCADDPKLWVGRWDDAAHAGMRALVARYPGEAAKGMIERMISTLDEKRSDITGQLHATCLARQRDEITDAQQQARASCAERRAIELGALVHWMQGTQLELGELENKVSAILSAAECAELATTRLPVDRTPVLALYDRYMAIWDLPAYGDRVPQLARVAQDAGVQHESELQLRAELALGVYQKITDDLAASDATLQRAYQTALDIHASDLAVTALLERTSTLTLEGNATEAGSLSELAVAQAEKPGISARTRARVYQAKGSALVDRGDYRDGAAALQHALEIIANDGHRLDMIELGVRFRLIDALVNIEEKMPAAVEVARDTVAFTAAAFGEHYVDYGTALNKQAYALTNNGDPEGALVSRRKAIAVLAEKLAPDQSNLVLARTALAADLWGLGQFEEARQLWADAIEKADKNQSLRAQRPMFVAGLGGALYQLGHFDAGFATMQRGIDEMVAELGLDHHWSQMYKRETAQYQLDRGKLDDAARTIEALEASYQRKSDSRDLDLARLHGVLQAQLELARGNPAAAEKLTRTTLEAWDELHGDRTDRWLLWLLLAQSLADQQRWTDAEAALAHASEVIPATPADAAVRVEAKTARVLLALGRNDEAVARARHARAGLAKFPADFAAHRDVAAVLGPDRR